MTQSVFDYDAINKRIKELGIHPIYQPEEEQPSETKKPCDTCHKAPCECLIGE